MVATNIWKYAITGNPHSQPSSSAIQCTHTNIYIIISRGLVATNGPPNSKSPICVQKSKFTAAPLWYNRARHLKQRLARSAKRMNGVFWSAERAIFTQYIAFRRAMVSAILGAIKQELDCLSLPRLCVMLSLSCFFAFSFTLL